MATPEDNSPILEDLTKRVMALERVVADMVDDVNLLIKRRDIRTDYVVWDYPTIGVGVEPGVKKENRE